jgi:hypothetical protein
VTHEGKIRQCRSPIVSPLAIFQLHHDANDRSVLYTQERRYKRVRRNHGSRYCIVGVGLLVFLVRLLKHTAQSDSILVQSLIQIPWRHQSELSVLWPAPLLVKDRAGTSISARAAANFRACFSQMARMAFPYMSCIQAYLVSKTFQEDLECSSSVSFCGTIRDGAWRRQFRMTSSKARVVCLFIEWCVRWVCRISTISCRCLGRTERILSNTK